MAAAEEASRPFAGLSDVSISEDIPVEGDISVPVAPSRRDDEFSTLDEPVKDTIMRDLRAVGNKFIHVLYPKRSSALLRDWDLWGPLLLCVTLALLLQGGAADSEDQGGPQFAEVLQLISSGPGKSHVKPYLVSLPEIITFIDKSIGYTNIKQQHLLLSIVWKVMTGLLIKKKNSTVRD